MARAIDKRIMLDLIIEAKKTDPETGPFSEWLAEYLVDHLPTLTPPTAGGRGGCMMDIEKLIERLKKASADGSWNTLADYAHKAATALSTLQSENEKLRAEVESLKKGHCAGCSIPAVKAEQIRDLTDAPKLRAELEQVKSEQDAAVESIPHECKTCLYHTVSFNGCTPDHDCTNPDGGCSNNCDRWKWRGQKKD